MKVWFSHAGEHSTDMRLIGKFKTAENAQKAAKLLNTLISVKDKSIKNEYQFSEELSSILREYQFELKTRDVEELDYLGEVESQGKEIIVDSNEVNVSVLTRVFYFYGAKIEIFSRSSD